MKQILAILVALILPPSIYFPTVGAKRDAQRRQTELEIDKRVEMARAAQRKLTQFHDERQRLDTELTKLRSILPPTLAVDQVRATSEEKAAANGVRLTRFEAAGVKSIERLQQQSLEAEVIGSAEAIAGFFRNVQNTARIFDVSSVTLQKDAAGWRADFILAAYALPDAR